MKSKYPLLEHIIKEFYYGEIVCELKPAALKGWQLGACYSSVDGQKYHAFLRFLDDIEEELGFDLVQCDWEETLLQLETALEEIAKDV